MNNIVEETVVVSVKKRNKKKKKNQIYDKPGRPKNQPNNNIKKNGVIPEPSNINHFMEFEYGKPMVFKKIFSMIKKKKTI